MEDLEGKANRFIGIVKKAIDQKNFQFRDRKKNRESISELGLSPTVLREVLYNLTVENYSCTPAGDEKSDTVVFGSEIDGVEFYIKLKLGVLSDLCHCDCISFHKAEEKLNYPLKGGD